MPGCSVGLSHDLYILKMSSMSGVRTPEAVVKHYHHTSSRNKKPNGLVYELGKGSPGERWGSGLRKGLTLSDLPSADGGFIYSELTASTKGFLKMPRSLPSFLEIKKFKINE